MPTTNNNGNAVDSSGNVAVDFVWGNFPMQPNDERADGTPTATVVVNGPDNNGWTTKSTVASARLDLTQDSHAIASSDYSGFPSFIANSAGAGIANIYVTSVLGQTTASALDELKDSGYVAANITTATAATNTAKTTTRINVTSTSVATVYASSADTAFPVGTKVSITAGTGIPTALVGSWTVTGGTSGNIVISGSGWTVADTGTISAASTLKGTTGTIKTQSVAAGTASVALGSSITITPWA